MNYDLRLLETILEWWLEKFQKLIFLFKNIDYIFLLQISIFGSFADYLY